MRSNGKAIDADEFIRLACSGDGSDHALLDSVTVSGDVIFVHATIKAANWHRCVFLGDLTIIESTVSSGLNLSRSRVAGRLRIYKSLVGGALNLDSMHVELDAEIDGLDILPVNALKAKTVFGEDDALFSLRGAVIAEDLCIKKIFVHSNSGALLDASSASIGGGFLLERIAQCFDWAFLGARLEGDLRSRHGGVDVGDVLLLKSDKPPGMEHLLCQAVVLEDLSVGNDLTLQFVIANWLRADFLKARRFGFSSSLIRRGIVIRNSILDRLGFSKNSTLIRTTGAWLGAYAACEGATVEAQDVLIDATKKAIGAISGEIADSSIEGSPEFLNASDLRAESCLQSIASFYNRFPLGGDRQVQYELSVAAWRKGYASFSSDPLSKGSKTGVERVEPFIRAPDGIDVPPPGFSMTSQLNLDGTKIKSVDLSGVLFFDPSLAAQLAKTRQCAIYARGVEVSSDLVVPSYIFAGFQQGADVLDLSRGHVARFSFSSAGGENDLPPRPMRLRGAVIGHWGDLGPDSPPGAYVKVLSHCGSDEIRFLRQIEESYSAKGDSAAASIMYRHWKRRNRALYLAKANSSGGSLSSATKAKMRLRAGVDWLHEKLFGYGTLLDVPTIVLVLLFLGSFSALLTTWSSSLRVSSDFIAQIADSVGVSAEMVDPAMIDCRTERSSVIGKGAAWATEQLCAVSPQSKSTSARVVESFLLAAKYHLPMLGLDVVPHYRVVNPALVYWLEFMRLLSWVMIPLLIAVGVGRLLPKRIVG